MRRIFDLRRTAIFSFLTAVLAASPHDARPADPQSYTVTIEPSGDKALDAAISGGSTLITLKDKAPVGGFALTQRARDDQARFKTALNSFGFYDGTASVTIGGVPLDTPTLADTIDRAPASPPMPVVISINTGPRYRLGRITLDGALPPNFKADLGIASGQEVAAADVLAARGKLLAALREDSYPLASVILPDAVLHRDRRTVDVSFKVDPGPRAAIGAIRFDGLRDVSEAFLRRQLLLRPGDPFSPSKIEKAREDLLSLPALGSVRIVPAQQLDAQGNLPLTIDVDERKRHAIEFGAAYSTDLGFSLTSAWHHRNLLGQAEQLNLTAAFQIGGDASTKPGGQIGAQFIKPGFLRRDQSLDISLIAVRQSLLAYDQTGLMERVNIIRKLSDHWSVQAGLMAEQEDILQEGVHRTYAFAGVPLAVKYDSTKSLLDPVSGLRAALSITPTYSFVNPGGFYTVTQLSGSSYFNVSGDGRSVVALRGVVAEISGTGVFGVPPDQRLYAGGTATVRGYRYQSVGPRFLDGKPTGGTALSAGTVEFRQRFFDHWGAAVFADAGQSSADGAPFSDTWRVGAGAGVRYYTPIGPIRLDVAVPLNKGRGDDTFELYIGIGQAF